MVFRQASRNVHRCEQAAGPAQLAHVVEDPPPTAITTRSVGISRYHASASCHGAENLESGVRSPESGVKAGGGGRGPGVRDRPFVAPSLTSGGRHFVPAIGQQIIAGRGAETQRSCPLELIASAPQRPRGRENQPLGPSTPWPLGPFLPFRPKSFIYVVLR